MAIAIEVIGKTINQVWRNVSADFSPPIAEGAKLAFLPDDAEVRPGMAYANGKVLPAPVDLDEVRAIAKARIIAAIDAATLGSDYPAIERETFHAKITAAVSVLNGGEAETILHMEAAATGEDVKELARKVLRKHDAYMRRSIALTALRRSAFAAIEAAESEDEILRLTKAAEQEADKIARKE